MGSTIAVLPAGSLRGASGFVQIHSDARITRRETSMPGPTRPHRGRDYNLSTEALAETRLPLSSVR